jgi:hypothetical protein
MTAQLSHDLAQLTETVARLSEALAASERRRAASARRMRWGAIALIVTLGAAAYAQPGWGPVMQEPPLVEPLPPPLALGSLASMEMGSEEYPGLADSLPPLHDLTGQDGKVIVKGFLQDLVALKDMNGLDGAMVKILEAAAMIAQTESRSVNECVKKRSTSNETNVLCYAWTRVQDLGEFFLDADGNPLPAPEKTDPPNVQMAKSEKLMAATMMAMGQVVVDGATLVHRLRRDSDRLRGLTAEKGLVQTMNDVHSDLANLNRILAVVPAMANEMNVMNSHMATMSYSMGSTMGRMGKILPW